MTRFTLMYKINLNIGCNISNCHFSCLFLLKEISAIYIPTTFHKCFLPTSLCCNSQYILRNTRNPIELIESISCFRIVKAFRGFDMRLLLSLVIFATAALIAYGCGSVTVSGIVVISFFEKGTFKQYLIINS